MKLRKIIQTAATSLVLAFTLAVPAMVTDGGSVQASAPSSISDGVDKVKPDGATTDLTDIIKNVVNILLFIVGIAAVILIIIGGIKYVTSAGDSNAVNSAKNTILYAVVGLVISAMAYAIVNFVVEEI